MKTLIAMDEPGKQEMLARVARLLRELGGKK